MIMEISLASVIKLLKTVDEGLCSGVGEPQPGQMCVEAAVCYALDLPHGDEPNCVGWAVRKAMISINDGKWSSDEARAKGLRKLAVAQLGSDTIDQRRFSELYALKAIQQLSPLLFSEGMEQEVRACSRATSLEDAVTAMVKALDRSRNLGLTLDLGLTNALGRALYRSVNSEFNPGLYLNIGRVLAITSGFKPSDDRDETLIMSADIFLEVLIEMESPGCQWLGLCDLNQNKTNE